MNFSILNNNQPGRELLFASSAPIQPHWAALRICSTERAMLTKANPIFASSLGNEVANVSSAMRTSSRADSTLLAPAHPGGTQRESKPADATVHLTPANTVLPTDPDNAQETVHLKPFLYREGEQSDPQTFCKPSFWISMDNNIRIRPNKIKSDPVQHIFISDNLALIRDMDHPSRGSLRKDEFLDI